MGSSSARLMVVISARVFCGLTSQAPYRILRPKRACCSAMRAVRVLLQLPETPVIVVMVVGLVPGTMRKLPSGFSSRAGIP